MPASAAVTWSVGGSAAYDGLLLVYGRADDINVWRRVALGTGDIAAAKLLAIHGRESKSSLTERLHTAYPGLFRSSGGYVWMRRWLVKEIIGNRKPYISSLSYNTLTNHLKLHYSFHR